jgi:hypothetical protein
MSRLNIPSSRPSAEPGVWQLSAAPMRGGVSDGGGGHFVPVLSVAVDRESGFCFGIDIGKGGEPPFDVAARLLSKAIRSVAGAPVQVQVRDPELATALRRRSDLERLAFEVVERLDVAEAMLDAMEADLFPQRVAASLLDQPGMSIERLRAFADGAVLFHQARPWRELHDDDVIEVASPAAPKGMRCASILGAGGQVMGIGFYANLKGYDRLAEGGVRAMGASDRWALMFHAPDELPPGDAEIWREHGLRVAAATAADDDAVPVLLQYHGTSPDVDRADAKTTTFVEGLCRAVAATTEPEIDSGRWEKTVETFDGPVTFRLSIPHLLTPKPTQPEPVAFGPKMLERAMQQMQRMVQNSGAQSIDEMNAVLAANLSGPMPRHAAETDQERAVELCDAAESSRSRRELQLIREALRLDPDCAEAYVLLARRESDPAAAEPLYRRAVDAGRRALGDDPFTIPGYPFRGAMESRPFMRAMAGLAETLERQGRGREAGDVLGEMVRLNPGDNQGMRYRYVPLLIALGRVDEARAVIESDDYRGDGCAVWTFSAALVAFRQGRAADADAALATAMSGNPFAGPFILTPDLMPPGAPPTWSPGDESEAMMVAEVLGPTWRSDPAAAEWLAASIRLPTRRAPRKKTTKKRGPRKKR